MMLSVGIDSIEISRIEKSVSNPRFVKRVFGENELAELRERSMPIQSMAACFCAKEAFGKALGTGVRGFKLSEVELLHEKNGRPYIKLKGSAKAIANSICDKIDNSIKVSVTHTNELASVIVIIFGGAKNGCSDI